MRRQRATPTLEIAANRVCRKCAVRFEHSPSCFRCQRCTCGYKSDAAICRRVLIVCRYSLVSTLFLNEYNATGLEAEQVGLCFACIGGTGSSGPQPCAVISAIAFT